MTQHPAGGDAALHGVVSAMQDLTGLRLDSEHQLSRIREVLGDLARPLSEPQGWEDALERLLTAVTVGESYFFREPGHFTLLRSRILPELVAQRPPGHRLRLWSAGCAEGEELYTLAIVLEQAGLYDRAAILGTDISRGALDRAAEPVYGEWSLRGLDEATRRRWFHPTPRGYVLDERFRARVDLDVVNLTSPPSPSDPHGDFDVVFCRNVLVHLTSAGVDRAVRRLVDALAPGGWLITGSGDPPLPQLRGVEAVMTAYGVVHRKLDERARRVAPGRPSATRPARGRSGEPRARRRRGPRDVREVVSPEPEGEDVAVGDADEVRRLVDAGALDEAESLARRGLVLAPLEAERHLALATVLLEAGRLEDAVAAGRAATYLGPELAVAYLVLGMAELALGRADPAHRSFRAGRMLLAVAAPDEVVPGSGGERAGRLLHLAREHERRTSAAVG